MFLFAFYFGLRVGEFTSSRHNIQCQQLVLSDLEMQLTFTSFKHSSEAPEVHSIPSNSSRFCAVKAMQAYLTFRGRDDGPLFLLHGKPVSNRSFSAILKKVVKNLGLASEKYKAHSFRIGAACFWAGKGLSEVQIRKLGRWHSDALIKYIRGEVRHSSV